MDSPCASSAKEKARAESRLGRQERKKAQQRAFKTGVWDRCRYRVPGRERYCAQPRSPHSAEYCGTHMGESPLVDKGKRVSCPVDPNHTVFEHQLHSHVKICNLALQEARMAQQPYYSRGINSGPSERALPSARDSGTSESQESGSARGVRAEEGTTGAATDEKGDAAAALNEAVVLDVISRVVAARRVHVGELRTEVLDPPEVEVLHRARAEIGTGFRKGRHVLQQASIIGHLLKRGLVDPGANTLHVEMGAGRGSLGHAIATAFPGADVTMVERSSIRRKAENRLEGVSTRAKIDIRDLNMAGLPSLTGTGDDRPVVAVAKHLCGAATDLALRAMLTLPRKQQPSPIAEAREASDAATPLPRVNAATSLSGDAAGGGGGGGGGGGVVTLTPPAGSDRVGGVAIATCCHHLCNWRDYTGQDYLRRLGFTESDFEVMRRVSAWISLEPDAGARRSNRYPATPFPHQEREREQERPEQEQEREEYRPEQEQEQPKQGQEPEQKEREQERNTKSKDDQKQQQQQPRESLNVSQEEATTLSDGSEQVQKQQRQQQQQQQEHEHANQHQDAPGAFPALTAAEKASAARECKRLLDGGRMSFLEERLGLRSEVVHFVEREVTPENALLLGFR